MENPFNPTTTIQFALPSKQALTLRVYDVAGRLVNTLINNESYEPGYHAIEWNGRNSNGATVVSGLYFYRIDAGVDQATKRMTLLK